MLLASRPVSYRSVKSCFGLSCVGVTEIIAARRTVDPPQPLEQCLHPRHPLKSGGPDNRCHHQRHQPPTVLPPPASKPTSFGHFGPANPAPTMPPPDAPTSNGPTSSAGTGRKRVAPSPSVARARCSPPETWIIQVS